MNAFCFIIRFDGAVISTDVLSECQFLSPLWTPDHQEMVQAGPVSVVCTQRFFSETCGNGRMPYTHGDSGCVLVGDFYLTYREEVMALLGLESHVSDAVVVMMAYLKWGKACLTYLTGHFSIVIWDPRSQQVFMATDPFNLSPVFYAYHPGKYVIVSNYMTPFRVLLTSLELDMDLFTQFSLDSLPVEATCYQQVKKSLGGVAYHFDASQMKSWQYFELKRGRLSVHYDTIEEYYTAFEDLFLKSIHQHMRGAEPVMAHISGGLDSTSVGAGAGHLLKGTDRKLYGFTAVPETLEGPSYRPGWYYHELDRIQDVLNMYPNIDHTVYRSRPTTSDSFKELADFYPLIDQPIRNVGNFDWILASLDEAREKGCRLLLKGQKGNGSISWKGMALRNHLSSLKQAVITWCYPQGAFKGYYQFFNPSFLSQSKTKSTIKKRVINLDPHLSLMSSRQSAPRATSVYPIMLYYGVRMVDPTGDLKVMEWCLNLPNRVFLSGSNVLDRRLLVRRGLSRILPESIYHNPFRGEQSADWYMQFNTHYDRWRQELDALPDEVVQFIWNTYDKDKIRESFRPVDEPNSQDAQRMHLVSRLLSNAFFMAYLTRATEASPFK